MAGKFDIIHDRDVPFSSTDLMTITPQHHDGSRINLIGKSSQQGGEIDTMTTNTIAALVSAFLASVFLLLLVFIVRALRERRRQIRGLRFGVPVVHTITQGAFETSKYALYILFDGCFLVLSLNFYMILSLVTFLHINIFYYIFPLSVHVGFCIFEIQYIALGI